MHCDTWDPDETPKPKTYDPDKPSARRGNISMHCDTWNPDEPSKRTGKI